MSTIELKTVGEILNKEFIIPTYQRGYRWTQQNINDLLNDIKEHYDNRKENPYCMQPIVVKKCEKINDAEKFRSTSKIVEWWKKKRAKRTKNVLQCPMC